MRKYSKIPKDLGRRIQEARRKKGISQVKLAEIIGVTPTYIGFVEQGTRNPSIATLDKIARALEVKISNFFD